MLQEGFGWERTDPPPTAEAGPGAIAEGKAPPARPTAPPAKEEEANSDEVDEDGFMTTNASMADLWANQIAADHPGAAKEESAHHEHGGSKQAALMIWLGILIDAVPESVVMGILVNTASRGQLLAFVVGVFLANFPEAMSSAGVMKQHGMRRNVILVMWCSITILTGLGAMIGSIIFPPGSEDDPTTQKVIAGIEGMCGGAMLCMIANTVLPEAFEQGGNVTGMSALMGFLIAIAVSVAA
jgi:zinc transporter ZupT